MNRRGEYASVAQLVEQLICNQRVGGSSPLAGLTERIGHSRKPGLSRDSRACVMFFYMPCAGRYQSGQTGRAVNPLEKSFGGSNPPLPTIAVCGNSSVGRATAFQAVCRGFESRFPLLSLKVAHVAQLVEHVLGKDGVTSSSLVVGF